MQTFMLATIGGGCFWCLEAVFQRLEGVQQVVSGYAGGNTENPSYSQVCSGITGHAEVVQVTYDPKIISYEELLKVFFKVHDPTTLNRQGNDVGTQYRSIILYHDDEQRRTAEKMIDKLNKEFTKKIVTQIIPFSKFYKAENKHQNFYNENPNYGYCRAVVVPKVQKLYQNFPDKILKNYDQKAGIDKTSNCVIF